MEVESVFRRFFMGGICLILAMRDSEVYFGYFTDETLPRELQEFEPLAHKRLKI